MGYSKHWSEALEKLTGESDISAQAILEYFAPLKDFLKKQNDMSDVLEVYEQEASIECNKMVKAEWAVATDTNNAAKQEALAAAVLENAKFSRKKYDDHFKGVKPEDFTNELVQRQLKYLTQLGRDALTDDDLDKVRKGSAVIISR
jgi:peptidyl-dipeptidase A